MIKPKWRREPAVLPSIVVLTAMAIACPRPVMGQEPTADAPGQTSRSEPSAGESKREPALMGYCPAAYLLQGKAVKGDPAYTSTYVGELYRFSSAEAKKRFDSEPVKFFPQFAGLCTTALGGSYGNRLPSDPNVFDVHNGKVYLFSSPRAKRAYDKKPDWFIARAEPIFAEPALDGYCPVSYQQRNQALRGKPGITQVHRSRLYRFTNLAAKKAFAENAERYLPQYDGFCAEGVSRSKRYPADLTQFVVREGKTYLFFDEEAKAKFIAGPEEMLRKADGNWKHIRKKKPTG